MLEYPFQKFQEIVFVLNYKKNWVNILVKHKEQHKEGNSHRGMGVGREGGEGRLLISVCRMNIRIEKEWADNAIYLIILLITNFHITPDNSKQFGVEEW